MRISKADAEKDRVRIVDAAAKILREQGIAAVGVDSLAKAAGVTHGGVYSHFSSKDELAAAAMERAIDSSALAGQQQKIGGDPEAMAKMIRAYVSRSHRDNPGTGCSVPAMGTEASRGSASLREAAAQSVKRLLSGLEKAGDIAPDARERAICNLVAMVGAIVLSRTASADPSLSDDILKIVRRDLLARNKVDG